MSPYRTSKLTPPPKAPWRETKLFGVFRFTVFPLITLLYVILHPFWFITMGLLWPFYSPLACLLGQAYFKDPSHFFEPDEYERDSKSLSVKILGVHNGPRALYYSRLMRKFMGKLP